MVNKPHEINHAHVAALHPSMRYNESEDLKKWQKKARKKLNELLGLPFERCDAAFKLEFSKRHKEFTEYRFIIQTEQGYFLPCHVWKPKIRGKLPVMICLQGHAKGMHISMGRAVYPGDENVYKNGDRDFAVQCIRQGICALMIEQRNFGECGGNERGPQCYESSMTALLAGRTTLGERVWDISRAIDALLENFCFADKKRIYCMGNSGGGTATAYAAALDTRIAAAMPSCSICTYKDSIAPMKHCACNYVPNIATYFDMSELIGMTCPRPYVIVCGKTDEIFPLHGVKETYQIAKRYYEKAGAPDFLHLVIGEGGHRFYANDAWPVFNSLTQKDI